MNVQKIQGQLDILLAKGQEEQDQVLRQILYKELFEMIYALAKNRCPIDAEDIVHDFFVDKLFKVSPQKLIQVIHYLEPFIIRSMLNYCYTHITRQKRRKQLSSVDSAQHVSDRIPPTIDPIENLHFSMDLESALQFIPQRQRMAFLLHYREGYKYKEFSEIMETSITAGAAKQLVNRAKVSMRQLLQS